MTTIPIERDADDAFLDVGDDGCVYIVCQMCVGLNDWDREVDNLRTAAVMWDEHVGAVHS